MKTTLHGQSIKEGPRVRGSPPLRKIMRGLATTIALLLTATGVRAETCPSSSAWPHAGCEVSLTTTASCSEASAEVVARISGQYDDWHDPHNNGTYTIISDETSTGGLLQLSRLTGNQKYTDHINFKFSPDSEGAGCSIDACSQSQVTSVADYSTNYCNSRKKCHMFIPMYMYCGA